MARWVDPGDRNSLANLRGWRPFPAFCFPETPATQSPARPTATASPTTNSAPAITTLEGFFDLAGLPIPSGAGPAQFQLTVEPVDPIWSAGHAALRQMAGAAIGNYARFRKRQPRSGCAAGHSDDGQRSLSTGLFRARPPTTPPAPVPASGDWMGSLSPYGDVDYFSFAAQANRTLSISATALDETGAATEQKAQPVLGIWSLAAPQTDSASVSVPALNTPFLGETRLDATINASTSFRVGHRRLSWRWPPRLPLPRPSVLRRQREPRESKRRRRYPVGHPGFGIPPRRYRQHRNLKFQSAGDLRQSGSADCTRRAGWRARYHSRAIRPPAALPP